MHVESCGRNITMQVKGDVVSLSGFVELSFWAVIDGISINDDLCDRVVNNSTDPAARADSRGDGRTASILQDQRHGLVDLAVEAVDAGMNRNVHRRITGMDCIGRRGEAVVISARQISGGSGAKVNQPEWGNNLRAGSGGGLESYVVVGGRRDAHVKHQIATFDGGSIGNVKLRRSNGRRIVV